MSRRIISKNLIIKHSQIFNKYIVPILILAVSFGYLLKYGYNNINESKFSLINLFLSSFICAKICLMLFLFYDFNS